jgi:streptogramin lyase/phosphodiesterase/alkaline phosphatase D-like protein
MCPFARRVGILVGLGLLCLPGSALAAATITEYAVPTHNRQPLGITAGPDGNVWFTQSVSPGGIGRSSVSGSISEFSSGISSGAQGITAGPDGNLWFVEPAADKVAKITTSGTVQAYSAANGSEPSMITAGPDGNLWFTESGGKGAIGRITTSGTITSFSSGLTQNDKPEDITAGPDGDLWFTESGGKGAIGRITTSGTITEFTSGLTQSSQPEGIAAGPDGNLWFTEAANPGRIGRITPSGTITEFTSGLTQNVGPRAITTGNDGNLYFTEPFNYGKIGQITPAGAISEHATPTSFSMPEDIATGPDGNLWFTEAANPGHIAMMTVAPKVSAPAASSISEQTATLGASVGPNSQATTYRFEYGTTTGYGSQTSPASAGSGAASTPVSAPVSGLAPATTYHFRAFATNATGTTYGADQTFTTTSPPTALTQPATSVGLTSATLTGSINPKGQATTYHFQWGTTATYGSNVPASDASVGSDSAKHSLERALSELTPDQTYHFRIVATNCGGCAEGTTYGADETFTSASPPTATTEAAEAISLTGVTLTALVNPRGASTTYHFDWGTSTAYGSRAPVPDGTVGSDGIAHEVHGLLSSLDPGTTYHYRIVATNCEGCVAGTVYGGDQTFTTVAAPAVIAGAAESIGLTGATLIGAVNPRGTAATYHFEWGATSAYGNRAPAVDEEAGSDGIDHAVSQILAGLTPGTTYHYRLVASNCGGCVAGTSYSADGSFATLTPPSATTQPATIDSSDSATIAGSVNPHGSASTYHFDWGETSAYGSQLPAGDEAAGADAVEHELTQSIRGLVADTAYHYRIVASDCGGCAEGTTYGADMTVTIASAPVRLSGFETPRLDVHPDLPGYHAPPLGGTPGVVAPPQLGRTAVVHALAGTVLVRLPGGGAAEPIGQGDIPVGALVDASQGRVMLTTAIDTHGGTQSATVWGGAFAVRQTATGQGMTTFALAGARPSGCRARARQSTSAVTSAAKSGKGARTLWASDHNGQYSTRGQNSVATVRGTYWGTVERCDGTLTIVRRGAVSVRALHHHRTVLVRAGHSYLAQS